MKHDPLAVQLRAGEADDTGAFSQPGKRQKATKKRHQEEEVRPAVLSASYVHELILVWCAQSALSAKTTAKVLAMAREQQDELAGEDIDELAGDVECVLFHYVRCSVGRANTRPSCARQRDGGEPAAPRRRRRRRRLQRRGRLRGVRGACTSPSTRPCAAGQGADAATAQEIDEADREAFLDSYVPTGQLEPGRTLADLIMEKIGQQEQAGKGKEPGASRAPTLSPLEEEPRD